MPHAPRHGRRSDGWDERVAFNPKAPAAPDEGAVRGCQGCRTVVRGANEEDELRYERGRGDGDELHGLPVGAHAVEDAEIR